MRLKVHFQHQAESLIPFDYQYAVQQWIYKMINRANVAFANELHNHGFVIDGKSFKLFAFSQWKCQFYALIKDKGLLMKANHSEIVLSFAIPKALESFVAGLFMQQVHTFYFKHYLPVHITVNQVEILQSPDFKDGLNSYVLETGARISLYTGHDSHPKYLSPEDDKYESKFIQNLKNKAKVFSQVLGNNDSFEEAPISFKVKTKPKSQKFNVPKDNHLIESIAYRYDFELNAPAFIHNTLYNAGAGEECSLGMGWVEIINNKY